MSVDRRETLGLGPGALQSLEVGNEEGTAKREK